MRSLVTPSHIVEASNRALAAVDGLSIHDARWALHVAAGLVSRAAEAAIANTPLKAPAPPAPISGVEAMYQATQSASVISQTVNEKWKNGAALFNRERREPPEPESTTQSVPKPPLCPAGGAARPISFTSLPDGIARLEIGDHCLVLSARESAVLRAVFSQTPHPPSLNRSTPKEYPMSTLSPEELQRQHHEIARMAADAAGRVASHVPYDRQALAPLTNAPSPASAGKAVANAYQAALKQLSAGCAPDPAPSEASA